MIEWAGVSEFIAVVEAKGFTAAAKRLNVSPAHISRSVSHLETRLGVKLLQRSTRVVRLTEAGACYHAQVAPLIADLSAANQRVRDASNNLAGRIRITAGGRYAEDHVAPVLAQFGRLHPDIKIELDLSTQMIDLIDQGFDLGIRYGTLPDSSLIARRLSVFPMIAVAAPEYLSGHPLPHIPSDLLEHKCIKVGSEPWTFFVDGQIELVRIDAGWTTNTGGGAIAPALAGLGVAICPRSLCNRTWNRVTSCRY